MDVEASSASQSENEKGSNGQNMSTWPKGFAAQETWEDAAKFNIRSVCYIWFLFRLMDTISYGAFFDVYLAELSGGRVALVGLVETVNSLTQVVAAFPLGLCADRYSRSWIMRGTAVSGAIAFSLYVLAIFMGAKLGLIVAVALYALYKQSYGGTMDVMIADAVTSDIVTQVATRKIQLGTLGAALGPLVQMLLLACNIFGEQEDVVSSDVAWNTAELQGVLLSGWLIFPFIAPALCRFKDLPLRPPQNTSPSAMPKLPKPDDSEQPLLAAGTVQRAWWIVPVLLEIFRVICLLSAGMTTRYFALLFKNLYSLGPVTVAALFALSPLLTTGALQIVPRFSESCCRQALVMHLMSCAALLWLSVARDPVSGGIALFLYQASAKLLDVPIYTMVLSSVKPEHRGKFFQLLSIKPITFGASALLGSYIIDSYGYRPAVAITGFSLLFLATPLLLVVYCMELTQPDGKMRPDLEC